MTEINYNSASDLRAFLDENGLGMRKKFGQNFLINPNVRKALVDALEAEQGETVWEIGPGLGSMTRLLLDADLKIRAFEIDPGFSGALKKLFAADSGFTLIEGDVLRTWPSQPPAPYLLGNLPYNIASALLADFIEKGRYFKRMVVTVQREVALRMTAAVDTKNYSSFTVLCASAYKVKLLSVIKGTSFYPRPNVDSQGVLLELRESRQNLPPVFFPLLRQLFSSRRKTVKNNLDEFLSSRAKTAAKIESASEILSQCAIDSRLRPENLAVEDFVEIARRISNFPAPAGINF